MSTVESDLIRIVLVNEHALMRAGLQVLLGRHAELQVVGEAALCEQAVDLVTREQPHVILLDTHLGTTPSTQIIPRFLAVAPAARVILLANGHDLPVFYQAVQQGAMGIVLKDQTPDMLHKAIHKVHAGEMWLDRAMMTKLLSGRKHHGNGHHDPHAAKIASLTDRERQVVMLIGQGLKNKRIAQQLSITETTVRHHLTSIFDKLDVANRLELMRYAYQHQLVNPSNTQNS